MFYFCFTITASCCQQPLHSLYARVNKSPAASEINEFDLMIIKFNHNILLKTSNNKQMTQPVKCNVCFSHTNNQHTDLENIFKSFKTPDVNIDPSIDPLSTSQAASTTRDVPSSPQLELCTDLRPPGSLVNEHKK